MAPSGSSNNAMAPRVLHFDLIEGMQFAVQGFS